MIGWLIYGDEGIKRNKWFAEKIIKAASARGLDLKIVIYDKSLNSLPKKLPVFAIVRAICPEVQRYLEERGVRVFNNRITAEIANDKYETYLLARRLKIPVMPTLTARNADFFPCVLKTRDGHGGSEVFWINDACDLARAPVKLDKCIVQKPCSDLGKDMRVYSLGGKITAGILRESATDFRSNYSLGGNVREVEVTNEQSETVKRIHEELGFDFVGVDFIRDGGRWVLNEIEDVVGTRMLYKCTSVDAAEEYIDYIAAELHGLFKK